MNPPQPQQVYGPSLSMGNAAAARRPKLPSGMPATCPMLCALAPSPGAQWQHVPLPMTRFIVDAKCQISMAFVTMQIYCSVPMDWPVSYLEFVLPKSAAATITELTISNLEQGKMYATVVVPDADIQAKGWGSSQPVGPSGYKAPDAKTADPELFTLTLPSPVKPGDQLRVDLAYFQPLDFEQGSYVMRLPSELPPQTVPPGTQPQQLLDVTVTIATGSPDPIYHSSPSGHTWTVGLQRPGLRTLSLDPSAATPNSDIALGYQVWGRDISVSLNVTPPRTPTPNDPDPRGSFVVAVAPPDPASTMAAVRSVVFILDRSGSMDGEPMDYAKAALQFGLGLLGPGDEFNVVAFDDEQLWFSPQLVPWSEQAAQACQSWIQGSVQARGLTNIMSPIQASLQMLQPAAGIPYMFLITDGCVHDEREICNLMEQVTSSGAAAAAAAAAAAGAGEPYRKVGSSGRAPPRLIPRLSTFAIGPYCNHFFLKQLATYGRGAYDVAFRPHAIQAQMQRMLMAAQRPVLSDLTLTLTGVTACELYPFPIPDLFCGMPVIIAGKYEGQFPDSICLNGRLPNGESWSSPSTTASKDMGLPLDKIFIKSRLDLMTARAWLQENPQPMVASIVDLSVATGVPCAYTRTVGFETTPQKYQQMQDQRQQQGGKKINVAAFAIGGAAGIAIVAGVAAAVAFGDIGATVANLGTGAFGALDGVGDCCGGCDCSCDCCGDCDIGSCLDGALGACVVS